MKVLHYIEKKDDKFSTSSKFVEMLSNTMAPVVNSVIVTGRPSRQDFLSVLYSTNPDIVHIHACWSYKASQIQRWCLSRGYTVVLSPHGGLMPNVLQTEMWKQKVPRIVAYQFKMVRHCSIIVATSSKELKELKNLGWRKRIALIRNPYVTDDVKTTAEESSENAKALYQKLIDTKKRLNITAFEEQIFTLALHTALMHKKGLKPTESPELVNALETLKPRLQLSAMEWDELLLAAHDRGVLDTILLGVRLLGMTPSTTEVVVPARFTPKFNMKIRVASIDKKLQKHFPSLTKADRDFLTKVFHLWRRLMKHRCESDKYCVWGEMNEVFTYLRTSDYDEPQLIAAAKKTGIQNFLRRLEQILSETHLLTEGFMPMQPINDKMTDYLRKQIYLKP